MENTQTLCKTMILPSIESQGVVNLSNQLSNFSKTEECRAHLQNFMSFTDYFTKFLLFRFKNSKNSNNFYL